jgi:membrane protein
MVACVPTVLRAARELSSQAYRIFSQRGARLLSASIAFYALLSVVPILVIALRIASLFVDPVRLDSTVAGQLAGWVGAKGATTVLSLVKEARPPTGSSLTSLLGLGVLVYASTRLFSQMTRALDLLWSTSPTDPRRGLAAHASAQMRRRLLSFGMVVVVGLLLVSTALVHAVLAAARRAVVVDVSLAFRVLEALASFGTTVLLFFLMFRLLPRVRVRTADALVGGAVTAFLFTVGSLVVTAYLSYKDVSVYGAASAVVMLMLWAHYSAHAFFLGAAFTAAHAERRGGDDMGTMTKQAVER